MSRQVVSPALAGAVLATLLATGCASYGTGGLQTGQTADEVATRMGPPTGRYTLPDGSTRLEYARGPMGKHTYMVDLDAQGRVRAWQQVLSEAHLQQGIQPGMPVDELLRKFGRPAEKRSGGRQGGEVWSYRYDAWGCFWWQVSVTGSGAGAQVRDAGPNIDPMCDTGNDSKPS